MSHAANLKSRQAHASLPSKRQRQSLESSTSSLKPNGVHIPFANGASKLVAAPVRDAKRRKRDLGQDELQSAVVTGNDASVTAQPEVVEISSGLDEEEDDDSESDNESDGEEEGSDGEGDSPGQSEDEADHEDEDERQDENKTHMNGIHPRRTTKETADDVEPKSQQDEGDMSFGDLLVAKHGQDSINVDVTALDKKNNALSTYKPARGQLTATNAASLGTVLTQALKTNDVELLESCLRVPNLDSIRATIERLHSSLAASLLSKLAERMHKRPGRAGSLMVWVQWTVVAHGGYLASQPQAMQQLRILYQVVKQRASGLQPLLALKGKLDMLEAQMQLRKRMQQRSREMHGDDVEPYIYVEGEESDDESRHKSLDAAGVEASDDDEDAGEDDDEDDEDVEDVSDDEEDEDEEEDEEDDGNLIDDEASEDSEAEEESDDLQDDVSDEAEHDSASDESEAQIETKRPRARK